jgi:hypothetical protein
LPDHDADEADPLPDDCDASDDGLNRNAIININNNNNDKDNGNCDNGDDEDEDGD